MYTYLSFESGLSAREESDHLGQHSSQQEGT